MTHVGILAEDGITHAFPRSPAGLLRWQARCGVRRWLGRYRDDKAKQAGDEIDCMACIADETRT
jgi:hypothetical protein